MAPASRAAASTLSALALFSLFSLLSLTSCEQEQLAGGSGAGNPPLAQVSLALKANSGALSSSSLPVSAPLHKAAADVQRNPDGSFAVTDSLGAGVRLTAIMAKVNRIDFVLPRGVSCRADTELPCDNGEMMVEGPFSVDLMTGKAAPPLDRIHVPAGVYGEVELEMGSGSDSEPAGSAPADLILTGAVDGAHGPRAFSLALRLSDGVEFDDSLGFKLSADSLNTILLRMNVDDWFRDADLSRCLDSSAPDSIGVIHLQGDDFCDGAGWRIRKRVEASGEFDWDDEAP